MKVRIIVSAVLISILAACEQPTSSAELQQQLAKVFPAQMIPTSFEPSPLPGFYEVPVGRRMFYISEDGRYLINGEIFDLEAQMNLTKSRNNGTRLELLGQLDESQMVIYGDTDAKHTITVFTDIDCGYCRKLHSQIAQYNQLGIRVRYLAYPRAGKNSASYDKAVSVWCAEDRKQALTQAKSGAKLPKRQCENPVDEQMQLGEQFGIQGTPAIILEDGELIAGYVPPQELQRILQQ